MYNLVKPSRTVNPMHPSVNIPPGARVELINSEGIAALLGLSRAHVTGRLTKRPDFPRPIINLSQRVRRWLRSDVEAWVLNSSRK